jgi:hypothetical protein
MAGGASFFVVFYGLVRYDAGMSETPLFDFFNLTEAEQTALKTAVAEASGHAFALIHPTYILEFDDGEPDGVNLRHQQENFFLEEVARVTSPVIVFNEDWRNDRALKWIAEYLEKLGIAKTLYYLITKWESPQPNLYPTPEENWAALTEALNNLGITHLKLLGRYYESLGGTLEGATGCVAVAAINLLQFNPEVMPQSDFFFFDTESE